MIHKSFIIQYVNELHRFEKLVFFPLPVTHFHQSDS